MQRILLLLALVVTACSPAPPPVAVFPVRGYQSVVIVGNSIVCHPPKANIGWAHDWGMAASVPDSDFVHRLTVRFHAAVPTSRVAAQNIAVWETTFWKYDLAQLDTLRQMRPDLLIVRIGENVNPDSARVHDFGRHLAHLITYLSDSSRTKVVVFGSFWGSPVVQPLEERLCADAGYKFAPLAYLSDDPTNMAGLRLFPNPGVAHHPGNRGMGRIAQVIWENI